LTQEQVASVDQLADDEPEDLAQIETGDHFLECMSVRQLVIAKTNCELTCSLGLLDDSSTMISYGVRAIAA